MDDSITLRYALKRGDAARRTGPGRCARMAKENAGRPDMREGADSTLRESAFPQDTGNAQQSAAGATAPPITRWSYLPKEVRRLQRIVVEFLPAHRKFRHQAAFGIHERRHSVHVVRLRLHPGLGAGRGTGG